MERGPRVYFSACAVAAGFAAGLLLTASLALPVLWYLPAARRWEWAVRPASLAMDWYGRNLLAVAIACAAGALTWLGTRRLRTPVTERPYQIAALWTATIALFAAGVYVYQLAPRQPVPEPLPPGYVPR